MRKNQDTLHVMLNNVNVDKKTIERYRLHLKEKQFKSRRRPLENCFEEVIQWVCLKMGQIWNGLVPIRVRGYQNEAERFAQQIKSQGKDWPFLLPMCSLQEAASERKPIIVMLYDVINIDILPESVEKLKRWEIFPMSVKSSNFKSYFQHLYGKQQVKGAKLLLIHLSVFDELMVLDESDNINDVSERFSERLEAYSDYQYELCHASSISSNETINSQKTLQCFAIPKVLEVTQLQK